jgi:cytochrome P450
VAQALRTAPEDMDIADKKLKKGDTIHLSLLGAHYDPALNPDPGHFDIERKDIKHFAFGGGAHYCLGAALGKAQGRIVLPMLLDRFPDLAFSPDHEIKHKIAPAFNGYSEIWLTK